MRNRTYKMSGIRGYAPSVLPDTATLDRKNDIQVKTNALFRLSLKYIELTSNTG